MPEWTKLFSHLRLSDGGGNLSRRLLKSGLVSPSQMEKILKQSRGDRSVLVNRLISAGIVGDEDLADFFADRFGFPRITLLPHIIDGEALSLLPLKEMRKKGLVPLHKTSETVTVAMLDPADRRRVTELEERFSLRVVPVAVRRSDLLETLRRLETGTRRSAALVGDSRTESAEAIHLFGSLEDYEVVGVIARGGFATVYKCFQISLDRFVALKAISKKAVSPPSVIDRFMQEGKIIAKLDHLNIVRVIEQGEIGETFYIVMEYVDGRTLDEALETTSLKTRIDTFIQICDALEYSHRQGVLHRDIKPSNILIDENRVAKILDFGIAHFQDRKGTGEDETENYIMGTPRYMPPEQKRGLEFVDERSDLYALAAVMFEIFTESRRKPSAELDPHEINSEVPIPLARAIRKCLAPNPEDRLPNMATLRSFLIQLRDQLLPPNRILSESFSEVSSGASEDLFRKRYEILSELKSGRESRVVLAEHKERNRLLLIRLVHSRKGMTEARLLARHSHPNIGEVLGVGEGSGHYIVIREYLDGGTLWDRMKQPSPFPAAQAVRTLLQVARALDFAQGFQVFHGHLHPQNILFSRDGDLKVVDFGGPVTCRDPMKRYFEKGPRDPHALDRFSMGVFLFEMVAGRQYFPGQGPERNFRFLDRQPIDPPEIKRLLKKLWNLVPRTERYSDHKGLVADLRELADKMALSPGGDRTPAPDGEDPVAGEPKPKPRWTRRLVSVISRIRRRTDEDPATD